MRDILGVSAAGGRLIRLSMHWRSRIGFFGFEESFVVIASMTLLVLSMFSLSFLRMYASQPTGIPDNSNPAVFPM